MHLVKQNVKLLNKENIKKDEILKHIERCGRIAYKSEDKITNTSAKKLIKKIIDLGHESVLEHYSFSAKFITDRGISHEIVRHRIASFTQESTRYCNYSKDKFNNSITVIPPYGLDVNSKEFNIWFKSCKIAELAYFELLENNVTPQIARSVLPNSLKTEIIMTANLREWRHFFKLRTSKKAHPQIRELSIDLLEEIKNILPIVFDDINLSE